MTSLDIGVCTGTSGPPSSRTEVATLHYFNLLYNLQSVTK